MKINEKEMKEVVNNTFKANGFFDRYIENHSKRMEVFSFNEGLILTNSDNELLSTTISNNESEFISDCMEIIKDRGRNPLLIY